MGQDGHPYIMDSARGWVHLGPRMNSLMLKGYIAGLDTGLLIWMLGIMMGPSRLVFCGGLVPGLISGEF